LGSRITPPPTSKPPETGEVDDSWDELVFGALAEPPDDDDDVFDRATAVPDPTRRRLNLEELTLDLDSRAPDANEARATDRLKTAPAIAIGSDPPDSDGRAAVLPAEPMNPFTARTKSPGAGAHPNVVRSSESPERARTRPEPVVERQLARVDEGKPSSAKNYGRVASEGLAFEDSSSKASPLELVETYRRGIESIPGAAKPESGVPTPESERPSGTFGDMQDRYAVGDFTGALVVAESILDGNPEDEEAKRYAQSCREVLTQMYAARVGPMDQIATVTLPPDQITWLSLDHRAGFLLSLVDGVSSIEEILDISGMSRLDALRIMFTLIQQNVIALNH
jgi:hypothetical protein